MTAIQAMRSHRDVAGSGGQAEPPPDVASLYEAHFGEVFRAAFLALGERTLAEEATQEAFARLLEGWKRLETHPCPVGWLVTTAVNYGRRHLRRRRLALRLPQPEVATSDIEAFMDLQGAIRVLPWRQRQVVILRYALTFDIRTIGTVLEISEGSVKTHLFRARQALEAVLGGDHHE